MMLSRILGLFRPDPPPPQRHPAAVARRERRRVAIEAAKARDEEWKATRDAMTARLRAEIEQKGKNDAANRQA